jgi:hypothetical protein
MMPYQGSSKGQHKGKSKKWSRYFIH